MPPRLRREPRAQLGKRAERRLLRVRRSPADHERQQLLAHLRGAPSDILPDCAALASQLQTTCERMSERDVRERCAHAVLHLCCSSPLG
eukprot:5033366-Pleurochrysis_carterae.AAC.1